MKPYVSIIIPTKNAGDKFDSVLKGIFNNKPNFDFEVIVIDSGSTDTTKEIIAKYPVVLIDIPPISFSHGGTRNLGAQNAKGEILVFITQDAIPRDENWLSNLVENLQDKSVAGVYGRQIPNEDSSPLEKFFLSYVYPDSKIVKQSIAPKNCLLSEIFFSNVNSAIRKSDWENHNFNEHLIMSEEQEWAKHMLIKSKIPFTIIQSPRITTRRAPVTAALFRINTPTIMARIPKRTVRNQPFIFPIPNSPETIAIMPSIMRNTAITFTSTTKVIPGHISATKPNSIDTIPLSKTNHQAV